MALLEVRVLGDLVVEVDGGTVALPASRRACALLGWLALRPGPHSRARLAALLWPDVLDASARASLRSALWALRAAFGPVAGGYLRSGRDFVELAGDGLLVDAREFGRLLAAGYPASAVALHGGDLLTQFDADWVLDARDSHRDRLCGAYAELAAAAESDGDLAAAREWAAKRTAGQPLDEGAAQELIRLLLAGDDQSGALAAYQRLAARLHAELGIGPAAGTTRLVAALREAAPTTPATPLSAERGARLVGRDAEVRALLRHWRASLGGGTAVAISGDGGMGKTRLTREVIEAAAADGAWIATGMAGGPGAAAPFTLWSELLGDLLAQTGPVPDGPARGGLPLSATEPGLDRIRYFEEAVAVITWAARNRPLALVLEDLHAADRSSLELLAYAGRRIGRLPVLLVLTRRRLPPRPELDAVLGALRARGTLAAEFDLGPLPAAALDDLVRSAADVPAAHRARIVALAAGSPLLAVETARSAADDVDPAAGLAGATRHAIGRLGGAARLFTELAAVAGRDLDRAEVGSLPLLANPALAATEALGSGLLAMRGERTGFRHDLLREAVYQDLADPFRSRLHETLADWLRQRAPGGDAVRQNAARHAAEIAQHFRLAGRSDLAADHLVRAAAAARAVAALPEAAAYLEEAASLAAGASTLAGVAPDPELLIELADVQAWRGLLAQSDAAFDRALELIAPDDDGALVSAWLRRGHWLRGGICHPRESLRSYRAALDFLDRGHAPADPARDPDPSLGDDPLIWAEALAGMAWAQAVAGDPEQAESLLDEAERMLAAVRAGTSADAGFATVATVTAAARISRLSHDVDVARAHVLLRAGRFAESYPPLIAAAAAAGRAGRPDLAHNCLANAASAAACAGDLPKSLEFADRCLPLVVPNGLLRLCVYAHSARASLLRLLGRTGEARVACDAAAAAAERVGLPDLEGLVRHDRGMLAASAGDHETAAAELALALDLGAPVSRPLTRLRRAEALARAGKADDAERELRAAVLEPVSPADFPATLVARMSHVQGLIALSRGDLPLAVKRLHEAESGWRRLAGQGRARHERDTGEGYVTALIDLGRPPVATLVEPARELATINADLSALERP